MSFNLGKFLGILKWFAIGMLFLSLISSFIMFSQYFTNTRNTFTIFLNPPLPTNSYTKLRSCACSITVFSAFGFIFSIFIIVFASILTSKILDIIFLSILFILTLSTTISQGIWYYIDISSNNQLTKYLPRNNSKVQKYIKNSIKELYEYAYIQISTDPSINSTSILTWEEVEKEILGIGQKPDPNISNPTNYPIYQYSDIYQGQSSSPTLSNKYISLYSYGGNILARTSEMTRGITIASLQFEASGEYKVKQQYCWSIHSKHDLNCKIIESDPITESQKITTSNSNLLLNTYLISGDYLSLEAQKSSIYSVNYQISFPIGYILIGKDDTMSSYNEFTNSYNDISVRKEFKKYLSYLESSKSLDKSQG